MCRVDLARKPLCRTHRLAWLRQQAASAHSVLSVCPGAPLCGAAGCLRGTTHWASFHLLPFFGANPRQRAGGRGPQLGVRRRCHGRHRRRLAARRRARGDDTARTIQLYMVYAPEPPFDSGSPETAPAAILAQARQSVAGITRRLPGGSPGRLGIDVSGAAPSIL